MKPTARGSFCCSIVLLLLCFLHEEVGAYGTGPVRSVGRFHDTYGGEAGDYEDRQEYNSRYEEEMTFTDTRTEERIDEDPYYYGRTSGKGITDVDERIERTAQHHHGGGTTARTYSRTEDRIDENPYHNGRVSGAGITDVDDRNERTAHHHHHGGGTTERTYSRTEDRFDENPYHGPRMSGNDIVTDGDDRNERTAQHHYGDGTTERTDSGHHHWPRVSDTSSDRPLSEERTGGKEEEPAVETKGKAHPIGLINALDGKATTGRSIDLDSREVDSTAAIIGGVLGGSTALVIFLLCCVAATPKRKPADESRSLGLLTVFQYLTSFNAEDVDIQLSAAGGFHVGYLNKLAQGINTKKQPIQKADDATVLSDDSQNGSSAGLSKKV